jgi:hypothetical protein
MQVTKVLYTANEEQRAVQDLRIPRWVDVLTFIGVALAIGVILGGAAGSGDLMALLLVQMTLGVMAATVGVLVIMILINWIGLWGLLVFLPFMLLAALGIVGLSGSTLMSYWAPSISQGVLQVLKYGLYGFAGLAGLGLLARVMEKVGVVAFFVTLVAATGFFIWWLG